MLRILLAAAFAALAASTALADDPCFGSDADAMSAALEKAASCHAAFAKFSACAWGSSADFALGDIVVKVCEREFLAKLTATGKANYADQAALCDYDTRARTARCTARWRRCAAPKSPHASFDSAKARTPLEKAICADAKLGRADLVLSRVHQQALQSLTPDERRALSADERQWMARLAGDCRLAGAADEKARACALAGFEARFTAIDECAGGADVTKRLAEPK